MVLKTQMTWITMFSLTAKIYLDSIEQTWGFRRYRCPLSIHPCSWSIITSTKKRKIICIYIKTSTSSYSAIDNLGFYIIYVFVLTSNRPLARTSRATSLHFCSQLRNVCQDPEIWKSSEIWISRMPTQQPQNHAASQSSN